MNRKALPILVGLLLAAPAAAQHGGHGPAAPKIDPACLENPTPRCALVATPVVDGRVLWLAWTEGQRVYVSRSADRGRNFERTARVTPTALPVDANGENRPKLAATADGTLIVSYTLKTAKPFAGTVWVARSTDGGRSFETPRRIGDEAVPTSQRFDVLGVSPSGKVHLAWIDKRDGQAAAQAKTRYRGAALYTATSDDQGQTFAPPRKLADHSCECCRLGLGFDTDLPVIVWRHVFEPNRRDHALMRLAEPDRPAPLREVSRDDWMIDACPHHGPALTVAAPGVYHLAWYTGGVARQGLFYARSEDGGRSFAAPMGFGANRRQAAHPAVLALGPRVALAWTEFDGAVTTLRLLRSADGGRTWSEPLTLATTAEAADHVLLIGDGARGWASWQTRAEGYRLIDLPDD